MKSGAFFKKPSDSSDLDELIEDDDEDLNNVEIEDVIVEDNDVEFSEASAGDGEGEDNSSEYEPTTDTDESMSEDDSDVSLSKKNATETNATTIKPDNSTQSANAEDGPSSSHQSNVEKKQDENGTSVFDMNEDEEEDETVRAIIAAIKKPRIVPSEIKLDDFITDICFHPEQDIIALATITGDVCLYDIANDMNTLLRTIEVHAKACRDVEFTEDGRDLLTCSKDKSIMITDMATEKLKKFYESAHDEAINKLYVIDANLFATGDDGGTVKLWDIRTKNEIFALKEVEDYISQILTNDSKKLLLVTSGDGYLTTLNIGARKLYVQSEPYEEELTCMGIYRGDSKLVVGTSKGRLYSYNWGQFGYHCDMYPGIKSPITEMIPITDRISVVAGEEGILRACHIAPFRNLGIVGQHNMPVECLDINHSGELIASSSHNNDVRFWNVKYFEEFDDIKYNEKHNSYKEKRHNLPSSKVSNASDFFAELANNDNENNGE